MKIISPFFLILLLFFLAKPFPCSASTPWTIEADHMISKDDENIIEAFGNVHLQRLNNYLQADYARLYTDTNWLYLKGEIQAFWDGDYLSGDEAEIDLENNVGWIKNGQIFMVKEHVYLTGQLLKKTGDATYSFTDGTVTSCDGDEPPWSIKSSRGRINMDGYANLWHPRLQIKDKPVIYSPYMIVPVRNERQSGFLIPDVSHGSEYGTNINLPYYYVIDDQRDATFYANYYSKRGLMTGLEYRHTPSLLSKGLWRADWLRDKEKHDTIENEPSRFRGDGLFRPNTNRYWLRAKYDGYHPASEWFYKLDMDYVSDHNYLTEFKKGQSGFRNSRNQFLDKFGRDIQDHDSFIRTNILSASRYWTNIGLDARIVYSDNLRYKNKNLPSSQNPTVQRLPEVNLNYFRNNMGDTPFEFDASTQAVYFWREYGTRAGRVDVHPRISLPLRSGYGSVIPRVGWRQTAWFVDRFENDPAERNTSDKIQTRGIYDLNINAFTNMFKVFELDSLPEPSEHNLEYSRWTRIKHSIRPELDFDYVPQISQQKFPRFDSIDRIEPREELTYALSNIFTRRSDKVVMDSASSQPGLQASYLDFFRIKFEQSYDFREARRREQLDIYSRRPFSDLLTETTVNPGRYVSLRNRTWYSFYESRITEHEHTLMLNWPDRMSAWFTLDFLEEIDEFKRRINDRTSIAEVGTRLDFIKNWQFTFVYRRDLDRGKDLEKGLGILYRHQCYSLELNVVETDFDRKYEIRINLLNLGSIGS